MNIKLNAIYKISDNLVAKEIEGELVIVPLVSGMGDLGAELYSLNSTGITIWYKLDGTKTLDEIIQIISIEFDASHEEIKNDTIVLIKELIKKHLIFEV